MSVQHYLFTTLSVPNACPQHSIIKLLGTGPHSILIILFPQKFKNGQEHKMSTPSPPHCFKSKNSTLPLVAGLGTKLISLFFQYDQIREKINLENVKSIFFAGFKLFLRGFLYPFFCINISDRVE